MPSDKRIVFLIAALMLRITSGIIVNDTWQLAKTTLLM